MAALSVLTGVKNWRPVQVAERVSSRMQRDGTWLVIGILALVIPFAVILSYVATILAYGLSYYILYYVGMAVAVVLTAIYVFTRNDPARFALYALLPAMPLWNVFVPPGRFGVSVFDCVMFFVLMVECWRRIWKTDKQAFSFFPSRSLLWIQLLCIPVVLLSQFHGVSIWTFVENFLLYLFFLLCLREFKTKEGTDRLLSYFTVGVLLLAIGVAIEKLTGYNFSMHGVNYNAVSLGEGAIVHRPAGFFQDPQKTAQFMSCAGVLLFSIALGGRFMRGSVRLCVIGAFFAAFAALVLTLSRSSLIAGTLALPIVFIFGTRGGALAKFGVGLTVMLVLIVAILVPADTLISLLPRNLVDRFDNLNDSFYFRVRVWLDTWNMFADHPFSGIGLGSFRDYLLANNKGMRGYFGIGGLRGAAYVPDQPESGYFKILYEAGVLGCTATLLLVVDTIRRAMKVLLSRTTEQLAKVEVLGALITVIVFGISFTTLFTTSDERDAAILLIPLAIIWARSMALEQAGGIAPFAKS
ncbi:MAG TPA: O-antigen ligase family protein [Rhodocyclaceae bacterium]|nr:O-antigen ligase family protein [Rhodocyclaceae bacterium]